MASDTTKARNNNGGDFASSSGQNSLGSDEIVEFDELDKELKSIFDNLRSIGNPRDYSLDEVLVEAISIESRELPEKSQRQPVSIAAGSSIAAVHIGNGGVKAAKRIFKISALEVQFQVAAMVLLTLASLCVVYIFPLTGQEVTRHFREIQGQVIK